MLSLIGRSVTHTHEEVFLARYPALIVVAVRLTDGNRSEAEDLVHEAFIRFTLTQPRLDEVQHLDAYLSTMLRNMHTSRIRRRQRAPETSLSILDFDSLDLGLHAMDVSRQLEVREMLRAACEYGCLRRRSSKVGSVFLLRFFHGYLPSEIAALTRLSSALVDALVFRARREAKAYVEHPDQLAFIEGPARRRPSHAVAAPPPPADQPEHAFINELHARIFNDRHDRCWSKSDLRAMYHDRAAEALSRDDLADLVGCPACLDAASTLLGLPRLADRWPTDTLGPGSRGGPGGGGASGTPASGRRRARAVFEHRPQELQVAVNGFVLGSHTLGGDVNELTLSVSLNEPIASIELLSEQGLCLVFLDTSPPPDGNARQRRRVDLSDGRHAQIEVEFAGPWPTVTASYGDPQRRLFALAEDELVRETEEGRETRPSVATPRETRRLSVPRLAWLSAVTAIVIWLLFWTPGTTVSAAERVANTIRWLMGAVLGPHSPSKAPVAPGRSLVAPDVSPPARGAMRPAPARLGTERRMHLELKALAALQHVDAYLGQELSLAMPETGRVQVRAIVETDARRQTLLAALGPLASDPDVTAQIATLNELAPRVRRPSAATEARAYQFSADEFPMFATVRRYLAQRDGLERAGTGAASASPIDDRAVDEETRRFATGLLERSRRAAQHAWALKHLGDRFAASALGQASDETQEIWRGLVREHARVYLSEIASLRGALEPIAQPVSSANGAPAAAVPGGNTWVRINLLLAANSRHEKAIQHAFAMQAGVAEEVDAVRDTAFWEWMERCERLAASLTVFPAQE